MNDVKKAQAPAKATWTQSLLDAFGVEPLPANRPGDAIAPEYQDPSVRFYATNGGGWSGNIAKVKF